MLDAGSVFDDQTARRLEVVYNTPDIVNQRRRTVKRLAPKPGERILDVGCGPGLLVTEMAQAVGPTGHVTGIDIADAMIALSEQRLADSPLADRVTFLKGDATALPFADEAFDAAVCVQVYEYVEDVETALAELHRVLKPRGRTVILDTDWHSIVWNAADQQRMARILEAWKERFAHPTLPRRLSQLLRHAGFAIEHRDALVLLNPEYDQNTYSAAHLPIIADFVVEHGGIKRSEADAWQQDLANLGNQQLYFFSLNRYQFAAKKKPAYRTAFEACPCRAIPEATFPHPTQHRVSSVFSVHNPLCSCRTPKLWIVVAVDTPVTGGRRLGPATGS